MRSTAIRERLKKCGKISTVDGWGGGSSKVDNIWGREIFTEHEIRKKSRKNMANIFHNVIIIFLNHSAVLGITEKGYIKSLIIKKKHFLSHGGW